MTVRVRFAPSPTGKLHMGNVRTALANVLFARKHGGTFVLRFEDTDAERNVQDAELKMLGDLDWLGMTPMEDIRVGGAFAPYRMSERAERGDYAAAVQKLLDAGRAYECFVSREELDLMRKIQRTQGKPPHYDGRHRGLSDAEKAAFRAQGRLPVIRFRLNDGEVSFQDLIRGTVKYEAKNLGGDPVIVRDTGMPLFTLAGVVDDISQQMTHVIRGEDHVTNTAVQVQIYEALGAKPPVFAHMPMLVDSEGGKLSKRLDSLSVGYLREAGYHPKAITSYLASLGFGLTPEPLELDELAQRFDLAHMGRATVRFDMEHMERVNAMLLHASSYDEILPYLAPFFPEGHGVSEDRLRLFWDAVKANLVTLADIAPYFATCFSAGIPEHHLPVPAEDLEFVAEAAALMPAGDVTAETWSAWTSVVKEKTGRKGKGLFMPLRLALTGMEHGPDMGALLPVLGGDVVRERLSAVERCC